MPFDELVAYSLAAAGVTTVIVQLLNDAFIAPRNLGSKQQDAILRIFNVIINMGLILGVVIIHNAFDPSSLIVYLSLALGQSVGSHTAYKVVGPSTKGKVLTLGSTAILGSALPGYTPLPNPTNSNV